MNLKKFRIVLSMLFLCLFLSACAKKVTVPDVSNVAEADAKATLSAVGLILAVEYAFSDDYAEGLVINTTPGFGAEVEPQTKVVLTVSKGPEYIDAKNASIHWNAISTEDENWDFFTPYIYDNMICIECQPRFAAAMQRKGSGFGIASVDEDFKTSVPLTIEYEQQENAAGTEQDILLLIPLSGLGNNRPTNVYTELYAIFDDKETDLQVNFTIEW